MNISADNDLNFQRGMKMLDRIETPEFLFAYWRAAGKLPTYDAPAIEVLNPWWNGLENLITL